MGSRGPVSRTCPDPPSLWGNWGQKAEKRPLGSALPSVCAQPQAPWKIVPFPKARVPTVLPKISLPCTPRGWLVAVPRPRSWLSARGPKPPLNPNRCSARAAPSDPELAAQGSNPAGSCPSAAAGSRGPAAFAAARCRQEARDCARLRGCSLCSPGGRIRGMVPAPKCLQRGRLHGLKVGKEPQGCSGPKKMVCVWGGCSSGRGRALCSEQPGLGSSCPRRWRKNLRLPPQEQGGRGTA